MALPKIRVGKRKVKTIPKAKLTRGGRKTNVNLSNTYGIRGGSGRVNVAKPGGRKGAVTEGMPANKFSIPKAKRKMRGN